MCRRRFQTVCSAFSLRGISHKLQPLPDAKQHLLCKGWKASPFLGTSLSSAGESLPGQSLGFPCLAGPFPQGSERCKHLSYSSPAKKTSSVPCAGHRRLRAPWGLRMAGASSTARASQLALSATSKQLMHVLGTNQLRPAVLPRSRKYPASPSSKAPPTGDAPSAPCSEATRRQGLT